MADTVGLHIHWLSGYALPLLHLIWVATVRRNPIHGGICVAIPHNYHNRRSGAGPQIWGTRG
jgi:hypothetical protein